MSLSQAERVRLQALSKKFPKNDMLQPTGLYLYCPANDQWYPAQCDEEGRLVIDPTDLDTRYLRTNGSNSMTEGLTINEAAADWDEIIAKMVRIRMHPTAAIIYFTNLAATAYAAFNAGSCNFSNIYANTSPSYFATRNQDNNIVILQARTNGVGLTEIGRLISAAVPVMQISSLGDLFHPTGAYHHRVPDTRPAAPVNCDLRYDPATDTLELYNGAWNAH